MTSAVWVPMELELEPCVANIFAVLHHFLGVDFAPCRFRDGRPMPWEKAGEVAAEAVLAGFAPRASA